MPNEDPFSNIESGTNKGAKVIKRVFHSRVEFNIYPNGKIYPGKSQNWFEDKVYQHKPKEKKKKTKVKESQLSGSEEY